MKALFNAAPKSNFFIAEAYLISALLGLIR